MQYNSISGKSTDIQNTPVFTTENRGKPYHHIEVNNYIYCPSCYTTKIFLFYFFPPLLDFHEPALITFTLPPLALEWEIPPVVRFRMIEWY